MVHWEISVVLIVHNVSLFLWTTRSRVLTFHRFSSYGGLLQDALAPSMLIEVSVPLIVEPYWLVVLKVTPHASREQAENRPRPEDLRKRHTVVWSLQ